MVSDAKMVHDLGTPRISMHRVSSHPLQFPLILNTSGAADTETLLLTFVTTRPLLIEARFRSCAVQCRETKQTSTLYLAVWPVASPVASHHSHVLPKVSLQPRKMQSKRRPETAFTRNHRSRDNQISARDHMTQSPPQQRRRQRVSDSKNTQHLKSQSPLGNDGNQHPLSRHPSLLCTQKHQSASAPETSKTQFTLLDQNWLKKKTDQRTNPESHVVRATHGVKRIAVSQ